MTWPGAGLVRRWRARRAYRLAHRRGDDIPPTPAPVLVLWAVTALVGLVVGLGAAFDPLPGQPADREHARALKYLPPGAADVVVEGHGWVSFTLTPAGGQPHRYLMRFSDRGVASVSRAD